MEVKGVTRAKPDPHSHAESRLTVCPRCGQKVRMVVADPSGDRQVLVPERHYRMPRKGEVHQVVCS